MMRNLLQHIPIPMSGLMLALFSFAKLSIDIYVAVSGVAFLLGVLLFVLLIGKGLFAFAAVRADLKNPIIASVAPTFTMGTMVMASMLFTYSDFAYVLWVGAFSGQLLLIGYFICTFMVKQSVALEDVYPSWFILFVGLGVVPITVGDVWPTFSHLVFGIVCMSYAVLLPIVIKRVLTYKLTGGVEPLIVILAAPGSLCLVGYVQAFTDVNSLVLIGLGIVSQLLYIAVLVKLPALVKLPFYPSFAAFTFPLVISATAMMKLVMLTGSSVLMVLAIAEYAIAFVIVGFVFVRYLVYLNGVRVSLAEA